MSDRYGVMGHPVAHSQSPFIHARFAEQTGEDLVYEAIPVEPGDFPAAVAAFQSNGGRGLNVTLPFKQEAFSLCTSLSARAERAAAVNTLRFDNGDALFGDNTDGDGLLRDLSANLGIKLKDRRVLLLGAGGAARGVIGPILDASPAELVIANRTAARARELCDAYSGGGNLRAAGFDALSDGGFDLVINATSASVSGALPPVPDSALAPGACVYDMMYAAEPTPFVKWGRAAGAATAADGLGMLVCQAAESFWLWRGVRPEVGPVLAALRRQLS
ncbi:MAG TPA: shikimate dehydrogenase [Gammaproteobacteria bacterium]